jgi:hypothetical protein
MFRPKLFHWQYGRQNSGYKIFPIIHSSRLKLDMHLIFYPKGSEIKPHKDPAMFGQRHYRMNLEVWKADQGGVFECAKCLIRFGRLRLFRPDLELHSVTKIEEGSRWIFSIGWLRKPPKVQHDVHQKTDNGQ